MFVEVTNGEECAFASNEWRDIALVQITGEEECVCAHNAAAVRSNKLWSELLSVF